MLEIEYKFMTNEGLANKLLAQYNFSKNFSQINTYYIDRNDILRKNHITVRIREKNNQVYFQIKYPAKNNIKHHSCSNLSVRNEYSEKCRFPLTSNFIQKKIEKITGLIIYDLYSPGQMITERYVCNDFRDIKIFLDVNSYLGIKDFEIELETSKKDNNKVAYLLSQLDKYKLNQHTSGKCTRFLQRYCSMK